MNLNNPIYLIVSYIFIFTFPGLFILNYFDPNNEFFFYAFGSLTDFNVNNFYSNIFFGLIPILLFLVIFFRIPAQSFKNQDIDLTNARFIYFNFIAALILINLYFFISFNYSIPIVSIAGLVTNESYSMLRSSLSLNNGIFNVGLYFFGFGSVISGLILSKRSYLYYIFSLFFCAILLLFNMQKSPFIDFIFLCSIGYLFLKNKSINLLFIAPIVLTLIYSVVSFYNPGYEISRLLQFIFQRIFFGEISDLPLYYSLFKNDPISFYSVLPPYINNFLGFNFQAASKIVALNVVGYDNLISVGYFNTIFLGEAYAVFGSFGAFYAQILIILNFIFLGLLINKTPKNIFTIILISYIIFKYTKGIFAGVGPFIFSTNQIFMLILAFYLIVKKNLPKMST